MAWTVLLTRSAERELDELPTSDALLTIAFLESFEEDPLPLDSVLLRGTKNLYRVRVDGYRIVYEVNQRRRTVLVRRIRPRGVAYKGLEQ